MEDHSAVWNGKGGLPIAFIAESRRLMATQTKQLCTYPAILGILEEHELDVEFIGLLTKERPKSRENAKYLTAKVFGLPRLDSNWCPPTDRISYLCHLYTFLTTV